MSTITETFTAGQTKIYDKPGSFIKLFVTTSPVNIRLYKNGNELPEDGQGVEAGFAAAPPGGFDKFTIESPAAQNVSWFVSRGAITYDRTVGEVEVVDGGKARTLAGQAFWARLAVGALAANYSCVQLWNPVGSLVRCIVKKLVIAADNAGQIHYGRYDTQLSSAGFTPVNKNFGGLTSSTLARAQSMVAEPALTLAGTQMIQASSTAPVVEFSEPVVITAGKGLLIYHTVVNTLLVGYAEYIEESV